MTRDEIEKTLAKILRVRDVSKKVLMNRENSQLEFKESFNLANMPAYARTMAAYANAEGGYLVFGVKRSPHYLLGIKRDRIDAVEPAKVTQFLNAHLAPELDWELGVVTVAGVDIGYIYTARSDSRPVVATHNAGTELQEGDIYYRYRAQTTRIRYPELQALLAERLDNERKAWIQHLDVISKSGPLNVAVLDALRGKVFGGSGASFLIDEKLLGQINVVRKGRLVENGGSPAITLVGELKTVSGVTTERIVNKGIHYDELVTSFLAQRQLDPETAKTYLVEAAFQASVYSPIFYFMKLAKLSQRDARALIDGALSGFTATKRGLKDRIDGQKKIEPIKSGAIGLKPPVDATTLVRDMAMAHTIRKQRETILAYLREVPETVEGVSHELPTAGVLNAVLSMSAAEAKNADKSVRGILLRQYTDRFAIMQPPEKTLFRRAVAYLDEVLYGYGSS